MQAPTRTQFEQMEDLLCNNESSTDAEMVEFFVAECGIEREHAEWAASVRPLFLIEALPPKGMLQDLWSTRPKKQD